MFNLFYILQLILNLNNPYCICRPKSIGEQLNVSDIVFTGKVLRVDTLKIFDKELPKNYYREMHLAVIEKNKYYKGNHSQNDTNFVITGAGYGDCGYGFVPGSNYIFYATKTSYTIIDSVNLQNREPYISTKHFFYTSVCDRTTSSIQKELNLLKVWLAKKEPWL